MVDVAFLIMIGLIGYTMRVFDFPVAPVLVGMILGPLSEQQLRRALAIGQGSPLVFLTRPVSAAILLIAIGIFVVPPPGAPASRPLIGREHGNHVIGESNR